MNDKSFIGTRGGEIEKGILKYIEIPNDLLESLDCGFIENFKIILRDNEFSNVRHKKREPKLGNKLNFFAWVKSDRRCLSFCEYSTWDKDIIKIEEYYKQI
jgi:hypothetical protein